MIAREIEKEGIPVAQITAMTVLAKQIGASRIVTGTKVPHPCGDPNLPKEADVSVRKRIVEYALKALLTNVDEPTIFVPNISFTSG